MPSSQEVNQYAQENISEEKGRAEEDAELAKEKSDDDDGLKNWFEWLISCKL